MTYNRGNAIATWFQSRPGFARLAAVWVTSAVLVDASGLPAQQVTLAAQAQTNAAVFREQIGRHVTFICPAQVNINQDIYGTDVYTDTSPICAAAAHAGVFARGTSTAVTIRMGGEASSFRATTRNSVTSRAYGRWPGTYTFVRGGPPGRIDWGTTIASVATDYLTPITLECPPAGADRGEIWGTDVYPEDSAICVAGVHAGAITLAGGTLTLTKVPKQSSFPSTTRHAVTSRMWSDPAWRSYPQPYTVAAVTTPAAVAAPTLSGVPRAVSGPTEVTRVGTTTALAPPTSLVVTGTPATAALTWQAPAGWTPTGYTVVRKTVGTSENVLLTTPSITTTRYEDRSGFILGKSYGYVVTALSADPKAFGMAETVYVPPPPQNVSGLVARTDGVGVVISWSGVPGATKYLIVGASADLAREIPATETQVSYATVPPDTYTWRVGARYEPGPIETAASSWPSVTLTILAPRSMVLNGFIGAGASSLIAPRTVAFAGLVAAGGASSPAPRAITLQGFTATGATTNVAPPIITLSGFSAVGGFSEIAHRVITLPGFASVGGFPTDLAPRTITLPGWTVRGSLTPIP